MAIVSRALSTYMGLAAFMGVGTQKLKLEGQPEQRILKRLGQAVHAPTCGLALLAVLAKPLHGCLE